MITMAALALFFQFAPFVFCLVAVFAVFALRFMQFLFGIVDASFAFLIVPIHCLRGRYPANEQECHDQGEYSTFP
jgi:hypothetical protein